MPPLLPQGIETLKLDQEKALSNGPRPSALGMESCVGTEYVAWSSALKLEGKVEQYMNSIIAKMREELRIILRDSVKDYPTKPREKWLLDWCSQLILVVSQVYWCQEVEQVGGPAAAGCVACPCLWTTLVVCSSNCVQQQSDWVQKAAAHHSGMTAACFQAATWWHPCITEELLDINMPCCCLVFFAGVPGYAEGRQGRHEALQRAAGQAADQAD